MEGDREKGIGRGRRGRGGGNKWRSEERGLKRTWVGK